ncbi:TetR/AcrR family transcriptional regulator [Benzoatithermus flavus]|uniref:Helix-turn-helix domain-containing protein n=1 Tax=Benzoatithermus flavus TaxID=3108223 RepID=A0ABU8XT88_9PROT
MTRARLGAEERRKAIVEAAMPLFAQKGFAGTTTREIARAACVSEALLFQHFPSKAALYQAIVARGCEGDPELEKLTLLPPCTATLVHMTRLMLEHFVLGALGDPKEREVQHRLMLNSFLEDGVYARLVCAWVTEQVRPLYEASMAAAAAAGDLRPGADVSPDAFWFAEHVAAMIAYARLPSVPTVPYEGSIEVVIRDALRFILRGLGLTDTAIARHVDPDPAVGGTANNDEAPA